MNYQDMLTSDGRARLYADSADGASLVKLVEEGFIGVGELEDIEADNISEICSLEDTISELRCENEILRNELESIRDKITELLDN